MKNKILVCLLSVVMAITLAACSAEQNPANELSGISGNQPAAQTVKEVENENKLQNVNEPGLKRTGSPYWELDSLEAFDTLLSNADGYAYYYIFEEIPKGLEVVRIGLKPDMENYNITFNNKNKKNIHFFVFTLNDALSDPSSLVGFETITVDGKTYYYHQRYYFGEDVDSPEGELVTAYFFWNQDGKEFLVHPEEPITPETIRKYNRVKKVEFNKGKHSVGLDTGIPLIKDLENMKEIIKQNIGIRYHKGYAKINETDDLLKP
ncbi:MAG: hypothetical protein WDA65_06680 [Christensenellales bacterium]